MGNIKRLIKNGNCWQPADLNVCSTDARVSETVFESKKFKWKFTSVLQDGCSFSACYLDWFSLNGSVPCPSGLFPCLRCDFTVWLFTLSRCTLQQLVTFLPDPKTEVTSKVNLIPVAVTCPYIRTKNVEPIQTGNKQWWVSVLVPLHILQCLLFLYGLWIIL